ncbi:hypothetical protein T09_15464 [Trichinella sp. T9]|nr:hypothetical protein T09_15464 [Trichinella sp. T9]
MQDECFPNLADGYQSNCYKSGCLIQARGDGSFCHHKEMRSKRTEDEFLAVMKVRKEAKCETQLTAQTSSPYGLRTLSNNVRVTATRNELLDEICKTNVFQIWLMDTNQIVTSRDVLFKPEEMDLSVIISDCQSCFT